MRRTTFRRSGLTNIKASSIKVGTSFVKRFSRGRKSSESFLRTAI